MTDGGFRIDELGLADAEAVFETISSLLRELEDEAADAGTLDRGRLLDAWRSHESTTFVLAARESDGTVVGMATIVESFAIYANGRYGVINELYVAPAWRSKGVGKAMLHEIFALARRHDWRRVDVTAPESQSWIRSRRFYEREGFSFAGPKLKKLL